MRLNLSFLSRNLECNGSMAITNPHLYINRELSWLEFNQRVLEQALDARNPLLERLKFLCIVSSNLDEFFEVRVAGLRQQRQTGLFETGPDGLTAGEALEAIGRRIRRMVDDQYRCWREDLRPQLEAERIRFHDYPEVPAREKRHFKDFYLANIHPVLTPLALDPSHPFPQLLNKSLNVVVEIEGKDLSADMAIVQVPRILPRVVPFSKKSGSNDFVFLGHIIQHHAASLFRGVKIKGAHLFRVTRNSNLYVDEEEDQNLLHAIEAELRKSNRGAAVRIEIESDCPSNIEERLLEAFNLDADDIYRIDGPLNFVRLMPLALQLDRPDLRYPHFTPNPVVSLGAGTDMFFHISKGDILLHHPYDSFQTVLDFLAQSAEDPQVLAIKQTLYRTSSDSPLVATLIHAARAGKQVTVVIELKARFDEAANIKWARMMREAGVDVVYGVAGLKTHAKLMLVVRSEGYGIRRYVHLGTGNYHPATAKIYTDLGLLTCRKEVADEVAETFNCLTGVSKFPEMQELLIAPHNLLPAFLERIECEIGHAKAGRPCGIFVKLNSLVEERIIEALYRASTAGVPIRLLIRGMCSLRTGVPGVSENIEVRSIVGRFLEHSRIYRFENGGDVRVYLGSADWMSRNLYRRIEVAFPVVTPGMKAHVEEILDWFWRDNVKARVMRSDGTYVPVPVSGKNAVPFCAQEEFVADAQRRRKERQAMVQAER